MRTGFFVGRQFKPSRKQRPKHRRYLLLCHAIGYFGFFAISRGQAREMEFARNEVNDGGKIAI
jgi:hypothetical protein